MKKLSMILGTMYPGVSSQIISQLKDLGYDIDDLKWTYNLIVDDIGRFPSGSLTIHVPVQIKDLTIDSDKYSVECGYCEDETDLDICHDDYSTPDYYSLRNILGFEWNEADEAIYDFLKYFESLKGEYSYDILFTNSGNEYGDSEVIRIIDVRINRNDTEKIDSDIEELKKLLKDYVPTHRIHVSSF